MLKKQESIEKEAESFESKYFLFSNKKARKKLDMDTDDDDDEDVKSSWKVTKVKKYGKNDDVTDGVKAYVKSSKGDDDAVKGAALVEVTTTVKIDGEKEKVKTYYCCAKVGGKWYLLTANGRTAENINDAAEFWEKKADNKKKSDDD